VDAFTYEAKCLSILDSGKLDEFMKRKRSVDTFINEIEQYSVVVMLMLRKALKAQNVFSIRILLDALNKTLY